MNQPSRRTILKSSLLLGAPAWVPAVALGNQAQPAASERIAMGIIGCGGQGRGNMGQFLNHSEVQVVAVCDPDANARKQASEQVNKHYGNPDCKEYGDFRELTARKDIDAVVVATPDHWHALTALAALRNGKDVYCEKPITHTHEEGVMVCQAVQKYQRIWQVGSQQRSEFNFRWGVELVLNGHIGKLRHVEVGLPTGHKDIPKPEPKEPPPGLDYDLWCGPSEKLPYDEKRLHWNWRWHLSYGGGQLMDWIGHHNDIAHWGCGFDETGPSEVIATGEFPAPGSLWNGAINYDVFCKYANGVTSHISNRNPMGTKWIGDDGWVFVDRGKNAASNPAWAKKEFDRGPIQAYDSPGHHRNFLECIKSRKPTICPAQTGHRSATPGHLGLIAMLTGRRLKWDPVAEKIIGDEGASDMLKFKPRDPWNTQAV